MDPKEKELEGQEVDQELEQDTETEETEDEEDAESTEDKESDEEAEGEEGEQADGKPKDKTQKRIDQLTAAKKTLEEQLTESKGALDEAREKNKFFEDELEKAKQSYGQGVGVRNVWTSGGKQIYELTVKEFSDLVASFLHEAEKAKTDEEYREAMLRLKECNILRNSDQGIPEQQAQINQSEQDLWEVEWGLVSKALLEEAPQLKAHAEKLNKLIVPIFLNRKKDNDAKFTYRKLADGGVDAKFKHVVALMKKEGIYDTVQKEEYKKTPNPGATVGKGSKSTTSSETKTFTRAQISKMSMAEFTRNEAAINKALAKGQIR